MAAISEKMAELTIRSIGLILSNSNVYGPDHGVTRHAADACFQHLSRLWQTTDVAVQLSEDGLSVNGVAVELKNTVFKSFAEHLASRSISNFTLKPAMSREQLSGFIEILLAKPSELQQLGEFSGALAAVGLADVGASRKVTYVEVSEDEVVVGKDALLKQDAETAAGQLTRQLQEAAAYLRGETVADTAGAASGLREISADTGKLSALIVECAWAKGSDGDGLAGEIVACLNRYYLAMTSDPSFNTQKTKKQIHKTLVLLEKDLPGKLQETEGGAPESPDDIQAIRDSLETMEDELTIDALSQEYIKRRSAIINSEKRLLRYLKNRRADLIGESDLKTRLIEGGLAPEDWNDLLVRSGVLGRAEDTPVRTADTEPPDPSRDSTVFAHLGELLRKIGEDTGRTTTGLELPAITTTEPSAGKPDGKRAVMLRVPEAVLEHDLQEVRQEVNRIVLGAEKRIERLVNAVDDGGQRQEGRERSATISRKRLFEILAEIGQELWQPLTVINCSVDTILSGTLGDINKVQREMLDLSADSAQKLKILIDKIIAIAGVPDALVVNKEIQSSLYQ